MTSHEILQIMVCPSCSNPIIVEGTQRLIVCSGCHQSLFVHVDGAVQLFQVETALNMEGALMRWKEFLSSSILIEKKVSKQVGIPDIYLVQLPFWQISGEGLAWSFHWNKPILKKRGKLESGEVMVKEPINWREAAIDLNEFGFTHLRIGNQKQIPFRERIPDLTGMVFESSGSMDKAKRDAEIALDANLRKEYRFKPKTRLFARIVNPAVSILYYPIWVVRYIVHGRMFQVVIDAVSGKILYAKAPGSAISRAVALLAGMVFGAFFAIDVPALLFHDWKSASTPMLLMPVLAGIGLMILGWRIFRYGHDYQVSRRYAKNNDYFSLPTETRVILQRLMKRKMDNK